MQLTVRQAAELLNVSEKSVYRWITDGTLPAYRVSGQYRISRAELIEWATANKVNPSPSLFRDGDGATAPLPDFVEALQAGGIFYRLTGNDKEAVLRSVVGMLRLPEEVDREFLLQVFLAREGLASTGVGDGIAIPHARSPLVLHVEKPTVTLCFLDRPIEFGALDGHPVHALFTVVSPTVRAHLYLLSRIAFALRDPQLKSMVIHQAGRDEILEGLCRVAGELRSPALNQLGSEG